MLIPSARTRVRYYSVHRTSLSHWGKKAVSSPLASIWRVGREPEVEEAVDFRRETSACPRYGTKNNSHEATCHRVTISRLRDLT